MRYGSVCSGIEAATCAWHPLGWQPQWFSEIEKFPSRVLTHHYPDVPNLGDMTKLHENPIFNERSIDLLVGGTPCQSFSVAGLRKGLDDPRGNLALHFLSLADKARPKWVVWENVPGVLSSSSGRDFGAFIGGLGELGYGWAYRVLDAQYFGVAQRRRRVFVVGYLGDWRRAAAVLFERESMSGNPAPRREKREGVARGIEIGPSGGSFTEVNPTLDARAKDGPIRNQLAGCVVMAHGQANAEIRTDGGAPSLTCNHEAPILAMHETGQGFWQEGDISGTLRAEGENRPSRPSNIISRNAAVRRLTPRECERLQGFPDDYTNIPKAADGPRYKALGNSMAVPVMGWIGRRIDLVSSIVT